MPTSLITYDAHKQRNYDDFYQGMHAVGGVRLAESVWGITVDASPADIRNWAQQLLDGDDTVVVVQTKPVPTWATVNASPEAVNWLSDHIDVRHPWF